MTDPALSVILVTEAGSECLRWTLECLAGQSIAPELECILVTRAGSGLADLTAGLERLHSHRILEQETLHDGGKAKAAGVWAARAPLVAFVEDHSYPDPLWAEAMIKAYSRGAFAAVGPVVLNANPATAASWGSHLVYYGMYMQAGSGEQAGHLPGNQSSYRKSVLLEYGPRLPDLLQSEIALHGELIERGMSLRLEAEAKVYHLNYSSLGPAVREYFLASRVFAVGRRRRWGVVRRAVYAAGCLLLPFIRMRRVLGYARRAALPQRVVAAASWPSWLILCSGAAGEAWGYALGTGGAKAALMRFEREHASLFTAADLEQIVRIRPSPLDPVRERG
ncbi:MAG TPA: glycosyltransferase [Bryobacteraceae bacterium]|nr:glycosyltransferase [Bryobacteraceae bacterium]